MLILLPPLSLRKPRNLFSYKSLIYLFCIGAITLLSACPGPAGPQGELGPKGDTGAQGAPEVLRECHSAFGPTACYNAATDVLTITGIDLVSVGAPGTADDITINKISIAGSGGTPAALSFSDLSIAPTIAKADASEFTLTLNIADRTEVLKRLERNGTIAYDSTNFFIVLGDNWNGPSSSAISMPIRATNIPPGHCGDFSENPVVIDGTEHGFFDSGTGTSAEDPYTITMRLYCDELLFYWTGNYPTPANGGLFAGQLHFDIILSTVGTYETIFDNVGFTAPNVFIYSGTFAEFLIVPQLLLASNPIGSSSPVENTVTTVPATATFLYQGTVGTPEPIALDATQGILLRIQ